MVGGTVETERLLLRPVALDDADALAPVFAKAEVWQFPYGRGFTAEETAAFVRTAVGHWEAHGFGLWVAVEREPASGRVAGYVGLSVPTFLPEILPAVEVGWRFDPDVWARGYATEGAAAALDWGFGALGLDEIVSLPQVGNPRSAAVAERLGMRLEREVAIPANERRGEVRGLLYVLTAGEWRARPAAH